MIFTVVEITMERLHLTVSYFIRIRFFWNLTMDFIFNPVFGLKPPVAAWQGVQGVQCTPQKELRGAPKELFKGAQKFRWCLIGRFVALPLSNDLLLRPLKNVTSIFSPAALRVIFRSCIVRSWFFHQSEATIDIKSRKAKVREVTVYLTGVQEGA